MEQKILFASSNNTKVTEVKYIFDLYLPEVKILTPVDVGISMDDVEETGATYSVNAVIKAIAAYDKMSGRIPVIADDAGYEIEQFNGMPGLYTHRMLKDYPVEKLDMNKSTAVTQVSSMCYMRSNKATNFIAKRDCFEKRVQGNLVNEQRGIYGSYYMNSMIPNGYLKTFAEMGLEFIAHNSARGLNLKEIINLIKNEMKG